MLHHEHDTKKGLFLRYLGIQYIVSVFGKIMPPAKKLRNSSMPREK